MISLKRAYDPVEENDGYRILVDRLWPRGVSKEDLKLNIWLKVIAPSDELREWFSHDPDKYQEFARRYRSELDSKPEAVEELQEILHRHKDLIFIYAAKNRDQNNAVVLKEYVDSRHL